MDFSPEARLAEKLGKPLSNAGSSVRLALYGHPLSGAYWEKHCQSMLKEVGFESIEGLECLFVHKQFQMVLSVYVDDFKLAGKQAIWQKPGSLYSQKSEWIHLPMWVSTWDVHTVYSPLPLTKRKPSTSGGATF